MSHLDRRRFLLASAAGLGLPSAIARAWAIDPDIRTGTIRDVEHVVILMQENRSFDHYFGTMPGVRGFGDRFPIPLPGGRNVWAQGYTKGEPKVIAPFPLNTTQTFEHMRVEGTPHSWTDAQDAWSEGRMSRWPDAKRPHAMGYFEKSDIPFQWALADAFTLCEAYHCSFHGGTNTNRLFLWSGTNDGEGTRGGPSISNSHDTLKEAAKAPYRWTTYAERLQAAGVSWKIYEDMADNFGDNPLVGFKTYQDSVAGAEGCDPSLAARGLSTQHLDVLRADAIAGKLPSVSWVISPAIDSEHPGPSSPAQGADYVARVLDCLTANPAVWARTVFLVMFDENDGYYDHIPPPAPPSLGPDGAAIGGSTVDARVEYHRVRAASEAKAERDDLMNQAYGLGPRVPLWVVSPWSRGGWVNAEVFDHTSVLRFLEARFGIDEPNISPWRRAVCGDLTSCFDFSNPNEAVARLPETASLAARAAALPKRTTPPTPEEPVAPVQQMGVRPSRALPYALDVREVGGSGAARLRFSNSGSAGAVFHVYDRLRLEATPRRYTLAAGTELEDVWPEGRFDLEVLGPNGFFRAMKGGGTRLARAPYWIEARGDRMVLEGGASSTVRGMPDGAIAMTTVSITSAAYADVHGRRGSLSWPLKATQGWYDFVLTTVHDPGWYLRMAGRIETGEHSTSDPAMGGPARMRWS